MKRTLLKGGIKIMGEIYKETKKLNRKVIDEICTIQKTNGLTAENVLEQAKHKDSSLHGFFDWDDKSASNQWRLQQARVLINEIKIIVGERVMYAYENVTVITQDGGSERVYKPKFEIMSNEQLRLQLVRRAFEHIKYWEEQNKMYDELKPIFVSIERTRKKLEKKWQKNKK